MSSLATAATGAPLEATYFARANLYALPIRPELPISEAEAEKGRAFYRFALDGTRVRWAEKWLVQRAPLPADAQLPQGLSTGIHFYAPATDKTALRPLSLVGIRELVTYFRVEAYADGRPPLAERVDRQRVMRHDYEYWDNGHLRHWRFQTERDQGEQKFDRAGKPLK